MKLLYCTECRDVIGLRLKKRYCWCGETGGKYNDKLCAEYAGPGIPIGFQNSGFYLALKDQPQGYHDCGKNFLAFVIPPECPTIKKTDK